jgi:hypothetical protein
VAPPPEAGIRKLPPLPIADVIQKKGYGYVNRPGYGFYVGEEPEPALENMGVVHDFKGDRNCGYYCLLLALSVHRVTVPRFRDWPPHMIVLRRKLKTVAEENKKELMTAISKNIFWSMDTDDSNEEYSKAMSQIHSKGANYYDEDFMKKQHPETQVYKNSCHWMETTIVLPLFTQYYKLRILVYSAYGVGETNAPRTWFTCIYDGRGGTFNYQVVERLVRPDEVSRTSGIIYDEEHKRYVCP